MIDTPLVEPLGDRVWQPDSVDDLFLDPITKQVRVAARENFVGRRRELQTCLRFLRDAKHLGVMLHGMGSVGKSTVAKRLLEAIGL